MIVADLLFTHVTLLAITAGVSVIFFSIFVIKCHKFPYSNKGIQTTFTGRVYKSGGHGNKMYLRQGILLFQI